MKINQKKIVSDTICPKCFNFSEYLLKVTERLEFVDNHFLAPVICKSCGYKFEIGFEVILKPKTPIIGVGRSVDPFFRVLELLNKLLTTDPKSNYPEGILYCELDEYTPTQETSHFTDKYVRVTMHAVNRWDFAYRWRKLPSGKLIEGLSITVKRSDSVFVVSSNFSTHLDQEFYFKYPFKPVTKGAKVELPNFLFDFINS